MKFYLLITIPRFYRLYISARKPSNLLVGDKIQNISCLPIKLLRHFYCFRLFYVLIIIHFLPGVGLSILHLHCIIGT